MDSPVPIPLKNSRLSKLFKGLDIFPLEMGFTYSNLRSYKSWTSGAFSVLTLLCILSYFLYLASDIWNFKVTLKNSLKKRDLVFDDHTFDLSESNFDFAVNLQYLGRNETRKGKLFKYISLNFRLGQGEWRESETGQTYVLELNHLGVQKCTEDVFSNDTEYLDKMKIVGNYYCPSAKDFFVQGSIASNSYRAMTIDIRECNQTQLDHFHPGEVCADLSEQQEVVPMVSMAVIMTNQFFSGEDQLQPIQQNYKMITLGVPYQQTFLTTAKIGINYAILKDSWFFESFSQQNISYQTVEIGSQYNRAQEPYNFITPYIAVNIILDDNISINERVAFNLIMALQSLGGFASIVMVFSRITVGFMQQLNFYEEMITNLYSQIPQVDVEAPSLQQKKKKQIEDSSRGLNQLQMPGWDEQEDIEQKLGYSSSICRLVDTYFSPNRKKISFIQYICGQCKKQSRQVQHFNKGKHMFSAELNLQQFIQKMRLLELYLELKLNPFQKTILTTMAKKIPLVNKDEPPTSSQQTLHTCFLNSNRSQFSQSVDELIFANQRENVSKFDKKLALRLGFNFDSDMIEAKHSRKKEKKKNHSTNNQRKNAERGVSPTFKQIQTKGKNAAQKASLKRKVRKKEKFESKDDIESRND